MLRLSLWLVVACLSFATACGNYDEEPVGTFNFAGDVEFLTYSKAYRIAEEKKLPLFVLIGANWCGGCRSTKGFLGELQTEGAFEGEVVVAVVDIDVEPELAEQIMPGTSIPRMIRYQALTGSVPTKHVGVLSKEELRTFVLTP